MKSARDAERGAVATGAPCHTAPIMENEAGKKMEHEVTTVVIERFMQATVVESVGSRVWGSGLGRRLVLEHFFFLHQFDVRRTLDYCSVVEAPAVPMKTIAQQKSHLLSSV